MVSMFPDDSVFSSASVSRWRCVHVCGYFDRSVSSRWTSGRAEVKVRHIGQRASSPETASKGTGSESTSTITKGACRDVDAQVAMQNRQRVWRHVVVTGSCSSIWQMGHRSSSSTSSLESATPFSPVEEADRVLLFSTLSRKERCARRAALYALSVGRALGSILLLGDHSSTIHFSNAKEVKCL
jgi:hypothetical protein